MGVAIAHRVYLKRMGIAHVALVVLTVVHTAPNADLGSIHGHFTTFQLVINIFSRTS